MRTRITDKRHDLQGQGRNVKWCVWQVENEKSQKHRNWLKVAHPTGNIAHQFQGQKVKVTKRTNYETKSVSYLLNWKAYKVQSWYTDGAQVSPISAQTSKVKGQGRKVT